MVTDPDSNTTTYCYGQNDLQGKVEEVIDALGHTRSKTYTADASLPWRQDESQPGCSEATPESDPRSPSSTAMNGAAFAGAGCLAMAVGLALISVTRVIAGAVILVAGVTLEIAAAKDVAGAVQFKGNHRAMNYGIAAIGLIWVVLGVGILS